MSVADKLGTGSSFGKVGRGRSSERGRAKAKAEGEIPGYELVRIRLDQVATSPLNPRRNFGTEAELAEFGEELRRAQLAACVAVSLSVYLELWPEHESQLVPDASVASVVLLNGERRLRSARHVGLEALDFVIRDDLAENRQSFLENLLKENLAREDFDLIERAHGVAAMVELCAVDFPGAAQKAAAARFNKDSSWVTNQLVLLKLPDPIQGMLSAKVMPERHGRVLARRYKKEPHLTANDLVDMWEVIKAEEEAERTARKLEARRQAEERRNAKRRQLSMDNSTSGLATETDSREAEPTDTPEVEHDGASQGEDQLSMDNSERLVESDSAEVGVGDGMGREQEDAGDLSMDNRSGVIPVQGREEGQGQQSEDQLSMDNSAKPQKPPKARDSAGSSAVGTVIAINPDAPVKEQAAALARALSGEQLAALWEEIHALMQ